MVRRPLVALWLISLIVAGLAVLPGAAATSEDPSDPSLLEPEDVPLVPGVPLDDLKYEKAESDEAPSLPLPDDVDDLPSDVSATGAGGGVVDRGAGGTGAGDGRGAGHRGARGPGGAEQSR